MTTANSTSGCTLCHVPFQHPCLMDCTCAWQVWRRSVAARKGAAAREAVSKNLFVLHPVFCCAILRIRHACEELSRLRLHALVPGELLSLAAFVDRHAAQRDIATRVLADFSRSAVHTTQVCMVCCESSSYLDGQHIVYLSSPMP
jgi:hypothetical protein